MGRVGYCPKPALAPRVPGCPTMLKKCSTGRWLTPHVRTLSPVTGASRLINIEFPNLPHTLVCATISIVIPRVELVEHSSADRP